MNTPPEGADEQVQATLAAMQENLTTFMKIVGYQQGKIDALVRDLDSLYDWAQGPRDEPAQDRNARWKAESGS